MADPVGLTNTAAPAPATPTASAAPPAAPPQDAQAQVPAPAPDPVAEASRLGGPLGGAAVSALSAASEHENTPEPAPPSGKTVKMQNPAGQLGDVPEERASEAAKAGYKPVAQMTNPKGEVGYVPIEKSSDALAAGYKYGAPIKDSATASPAASITGGDVAKALVSTPSLNKVNSAIDNAISSIENYTPAGREEHPVLAQVGDLIRSAKNLLFGGQEAGNPFGTSSGVLNNPVTQAMAVVPDAAEIGAAAEEGLTAKAKQAVSKVQDVTEDMFKHAPETPKPQHGTPVSVASPLDRATVNSLPGGKELSDEAFNMLQQHVGNTIPVGSTPKNTVMRAVRPVLKTIDDTGAAMNKLIQAAPDLKTSLIEDPNSTVLQDIQDIRENLPTGLDDAANKAVDKQVEAYHDALSSKDPKELLAARRKLGNQIDWANINWNPETAGDVANTTKVKLYHAMGNKLKTDVAGVADLDKILSPNLELRSQFDSKLGKAVSRDPVEADSQAASEHLKGLKTLNTAAHNEKINRNVAVAKKVLTALGVGAAGAIGFDLAK